MPCKITQTLYLLFKFYYPWLILTSKMWKGIDYIFIPKHMQPTVYTLRSGHCTCVNMRAQLSLRIKIQHILFVGYQRDYLFSDCSLISSLCNLIFYLTSTLTSSDKKTCQLFKENLPTFVNKSVFERRETPFILNMLKGKFSFRQLRVLYSSIFDVYGTFLNTLYIFNNEFLKIFLKFSTAKAFILQQLLQSNV